jgi:hypothetical protein
MSELQTWTERRRDQARIEALEADLSTARKQLAELAAAYTTALAALAAARAWWADAILAALASGFLAVFMLRALL